MRRDTLVFGVAGMILLMAVRMTASAATYGWADIQVPSKERPIEFYKGVCEEEVIPQFVAELKKRNPSIDEKKAAEKITVQANIERGRLVVYLEAEHEQTGIADAHRFAEMALRKFIALDQAERAKLIERSIREQDELNETIGPLQEEMEVLRKDPRLQVSKEEMEPLANLLGSHREELRRAELKKAELRAKLELLSERAGQVRDSVSIEEVALLQKTARELEMQLDETSKLHHEMQLKRCQIVLQQKEEKVKELKMLHEQRLVSAGQVKDTEADLELARYDYELAKMQMAQVGRRLADVRDDLAKAKLRLAETGGLRLAAIVAEQTLQCQTEMAAIEVKMDYLRDKIESLEKEIAEIDSFKADLGKCGGELRDLDTRLGDLQKQEREAETRMMRARSAEQKLQESYRVTSVQRIEEEEKKGAYYVMGEVKNPGPRTFELKTSLLKAIEAAGGFTEGADPACVIVIHRAGGSIPRPPRPGVPSRPVPAAPGRPGRPPTRPMREIIDCKAILEGESPDDFMIEDGDVILVPERIP